MTLQTVTVLPSPADSLTAGCRRCGAAAGSRCTAASGSPTSAHADRRWQAAAARDAAPVGLCLTCPNVVGGTAVQCDRCTAAVSPLQAAADDAAALTVPADDAAPAGWLTVTLPPVSDRDALQAAADDAAAAVAAVAAADCRVIDAADRPAYVLAVTDRDGLRAAAADALAAVTAARWGATAGDRLPTVTSVAPVPYAVSLPALWDGSPSEDRPDNSAAGIDEWLAVSAVSDVIDGTNDAGKATCAVYVTGRLQIGGLPLSYAGSQHVVTGYACRVVTAAGPDDAADRALTAATADAVRLGKAARAAARAALPVRGALGVAGLSGYVVGPVTADGCSPTADTSFAVDADTYDRLRPAVMRRAYGNAARVQTGTGRSAAAYVRAGATASGMTVRPDQIDDAVQDAALLLHGWLSDGSLTALTDRLQADAADADDVLTDDDAAARALSILIGSAARDAVRRQTGAARPTAAASRLTAWQQGHGADPRLAAVPSDVTDAAARADAAASLPLPAAPARWSDVLAGQSTVTGPLVLAAPATSCPVGIRVKGAGGYLMTGGTDALGTALLGTVSRPAAGPALPDGTLPTVTALAFPRLAALLLHGGNADAAARSCGVPVKADGSCCSPRAFARWQTAARAEWSAFAGTAAPAAESAADALTALAGSVVPAGTR